MSSEDWAWPALIRSLQTDIAHLRELMDEARRETSAAREQHRRELDALIDQLRAVRHQLDPIVEERRAARDAQRQTVWKWIERAGWGGILIVGYALWHWLNNHTDR